MSARRHLAAWLLAAGALLAIWSTCLTISFGHTQGLVLHLATVATSIAVALLLAFAPRPSSEPRVVSRLGALLLGLVGIVDLAVLIERGLAWRSALGLEALVIPLMVTYWGVAFAIASGARGQTPAGAVPEERRRLPAAYAALLLIALLPIGGVEVILQQLQQAAHEQAARQAADSLARVARMHDVKTAQALVSRTPLPSGVRVLLRLPSGSLVPEDALAELRDWPHVERPLDGALRGGMVRVCYPPPLLGVPAGLVLSLLLVAGAIALAILVGNRAQRDLRALLTMTETHGHAKQQADGQPAPVPSLIFQGSRRFALSLQRLFEKVPRLTVEAYLAVERTEDARRFKSRFLATMSHDLRSPLNSILGFSELLLRGLEGPIQPGQQVVLAAMQASGQSLLRLLNEILETAKLESGTLELQRQPSPPAELLSNAVKEAARGRAHQTAERLQLELQAGMPLCPVDPLRLTQAFTHLFNAALDAGGDEPIRVRAAVLEDKGERYLVVNATYRDEAGSRLGPEIFEGFRKIIGRPGLQLALPLARRLIEVHQGTIELRADAQPAMMHIRCLVPVGQKRPPRQGRPG